jgi:hypothetical protein
VATWEIIFFFGLFGVWTVGSLVEMALEGIRASKVECLVFTLEMHGYKANKWDGLIYRRCVLGTHLSIFPCSY